MDVPFEVDMGGAQNTGWKPLTGIQAHDQAIGGRLQRFGGLTQQQGDAFSQQRLSDGRGHLPVERREYLAGC